MLCTVWPLDVATWPRPAYMAASIAQPTETHLKLLTQHLRHNLQAQAAWIHNVSPTRGYGTRCFDDDWTMSSNPSRTGEYQQLSVNTQTSLAAGTAGSTVELTPMGYWISTPSRRTQSFKRFIGQLLHSHCTLPSPSWDLWFYRLLLALCVVELQPGTGME
jgi:hypothetical protein